MAKLGPASKGPRVYARNRFRVGDRVQFTPEGHAQFPRVRFKTGVVIGFGRQADDLVRIRRSPRGNPELYHVDLLERCDEPPAADAVREDSQ